MTIQHSRRLLPKQSQSITQIQCRRGETKPEEDGQVLGGRRPVDCTGQQQAQNRRAATVGDLGREKRASQSYTVRLPPGETYTETLANDGERNSSARRKPLCSSCLLEHRCRVEETVHTLEMKTEGSPNLSVVSLVDLYCPHLNMNPLPYPPSPMWCNSLLSSMSRWC